MPKAFARVHFYHLAAATSILSLAVLATITPELPAITDKAEALSPILPPATPAVAKPTLAQIAPIHAELAVELAAADSPETDVGYSAVEALPPSGVIITFRINEPYDADSGLSAFAKRETLAFAAEELTYSAFAKAEPAVVVTEAPRGLPENRAKVEGNSTALPMVLAYAPAPHELQAPFDAVLGGYRPSPQEEIAINMPRPRPEPEEVLTWLEGRALGQFAPGMHHWVRSKLPESVHKASEQKCLAEGIYFESRGESQLGQAAVAQVILNRVRNPAYPNTICKVVYQNKNWRNACQFSFACDGRPERVHSQRAWRTAVRIAEEAISGETWIAEVGDATHYYANYVSPGWARRMIRTDTIGTHIFFRTKRGGWS